MDLDHKEKSNLGAYYLQYRLPKIISRLKMQVRNVMSSEIMVKTILCFL